MRSFTPYEPALCILSKWLTTTNTDCLIVKTYHRSNEPTNQPINRHQSCAALPCFECQTLNQAFGLLLLHLCWSWEVNHWSQPALGHILAVEQQTCSAPPSTHKRQHCLKTDYKLPCVCVCVSLCIREWVGGGRNAFRGWIYTCMNLFA